MWPIRIRDLRILRCEVLFLPKRGFPRYEFYGPMWRGALGNGLREMGGDARDKWLKTTHGGEDAPRPFRIVSAYPHEVLGPGRCVRAVYELFGAATEESDLFRRAWTVVANRNGFGPAGCRASVYGHRVLADKRLFDCLDTTCPSRIVLSSLCSLKEYGKSVAPTSARLSLAGLRRAEVLGKAFALPEDDERIVYATEDPLLDLRSFLTPQRFKRRSARGGEGSLRGWTGAIEPRWVSDPTAAVGLACASALGVGRNVPFGCGRVDLDYSVV